MLIHLQNVSVKFNITNNLMIRHHQDMKIILICIYIIIIPTALYVHIKRKTLVLFTEYINHLNIWLLKKLIIYYYYYYQSAPVPFLLFSNASLIPPVSCAAVTSEFPQCWVK